MLMTTTPTLEGVKIIEYKGLVVSQTLEGTNFVRDIVSQWKNFFGGRNKTYEEVFERARATALTELEERANALGANAIVGMRIDYESVGAANDLLLVTATGTAVTIAPPDAPAAV